MGEDGATHQPIEHLASLRAMPNVQVLRPGDAEEVVSAWHIAMESKDHPVVLSLTRQNVPVYKKDDANWKQTIRKGAYIVHKGANTPDITVLATGSEVNLALDAAKLVNGKTVRVVSVLDRELFDVQDEAFQKQILGGAKRVVVAEAGSKSGWEGFVTSKRDLFTLNQFGVSGPGKEVAKALGFTAEKLAELLQN